MTTRWQVSNPEPRRGTTQKLKGRCLLVKTPKQTESLWFILAVFAVVGASQGQNINADSPLRDQLSRVHIKKCRCGAGLRRSTWSKVHFYSHVSEHKLSAHSRQWSASFQAQNRTVPTRPSEKLCPSGFALLLRFKYRTECCTAATKRLEENTTGR